MDRENEGRSCTPRTLKARRTVVIFTVALSVLLLGTDALASGPPALANPCAPAIATASFALTTQRGLIDLYYFEPLGKPVTFYECIGKRAHRLGELPSKPGSDRTVFYAATSWSCDRLTRHFAATTGGPGGQGTLGTASVRTRSCARRFALGVPRRTSPGRLARVSVIDRWGIGGIRTRLCLTARHVKRDCRDVAFAKAVGVVSRRFRPATRGRWRVELQVRGYRVRESIAVGVHSAAPRAGLPTVLATGDSTMQGVESFLSDELDQRATVVSDPRPGLSLSGSNQWAAIAASQVANVRPDVTAISIGANEGLPMLGADGATHRCCDEVWTSEWARRMRATMLTYARGGRARVIAMTIPAPRDPRRAVITTAVNAAIVRAGEGLAGVRVLRMDLLFSPQGFREVIRYGGEDVDVREGDGTHLNVSGTAIAARILAQAIGLRRR